MTLASRKNLCQGVRLPAILASVLFFKIHCHNCSLSFFQHQSVVISFHNKGVFSFLSDITKIVRHIVVTLVDCLSGFIYRFCKAHPQSSHDRYSFKRSSRNLRSPISVHNIYITYLFGLLTKREAPDCWLMNNQNCLDAFFLFRLFIRTTNWST